MHQVYYPYPLIQALSFPIKSTSSNAFTLYIATQDSILSYKMQENDLLLIGTKKQIFKSISRIVKTNDILLVQADSQIHLLDASINIKFTIPSSTNVIVFAVYATRLAIAVKSKIHVFNILNSSYISTSLLTMEGTKNMVWMDELRLCVATRNGVSVVHVNSSVVTTVLTFASTLFTVPCLLTSCGNGMLLTRSSKLNGNADTSHIMELEGYSITHTITWSTTPLDIIFSKPYVIGVLADKIVVKRLKNGKVVQEMPIEALNIISGSNDIIVAGCHSVYKLLPLDFSDQIEELIDAFQFEDAIDLIYEFEWGDEEERDANVVRVKSVQACYMFHTLAKHKEAIDILKGLNASPLDVVNLYPEYSTDPSDELSPETALNVLMEYLIQERSRLGKLRAENFVDTDEIFRVVDTTLFKVYLRLNVSLLKSLLRIQNFCDLKECSDLLRKKDLHDLLVEFYKGKQLHKMACKYLVDRNDIKGLAQYLKGLDATQLDIIFHYSIHVQDIDLLMDLFCDNIYLTDSATRIRIFKHLPSDAAVQYLERIVDVDTTAELHDNLVIYYVKDLDHSRDALRCFLRQSRYYNAAGLLKHFESKDLVYERTILLNRLKRHDEAISLFLNKMDSLRFAIEYCKDCGDDTVYTILLKRLIKREGDVIKFVTEFAHLVDLVVVLEYLDNSTALCDVLNILTRNLEGFKSLDMMAKIEASIQGSAVSTLKKSLKTERKRNVEVEEGSVCSVCFKRIGGGVFAVEGGSIMHVYCS